MARSAPREPYLELASVCILRDRQPDVIDPRSKAFRDAVAGDLPVWLDFNLHTKTGRWIDPWMSLSDERVRGDGFEEILDILRAEGRFDATAELIFKSLPDLNELGVARMLKRALGPEGTRSALYPLIGFIPTSTLDKPSPSPAEQQL